MDQKRAIPKLLGISAVVGILAGVGVIAFLAVQHQLQTLLWTTIPDAIGGTPWWWVLLVLFAGAVGVWAALKLPGHGGHKPLDGLGFDIGPREIGSVVAAALISLSVGAVVGPEAPLMAVGSAIGGFVAIRAPKPAQQVLMVAGAVAAITMILGNPMISAVLVLEAAVLKGGPGGRKVMLGVLPLLIAMGFGYLIQVGVGDWSGVGTAQLSVPGLPEYPNVQALDIVFALIVAGLTALFAVFAVEAGTLFQDRIPGQLQRLLLAAGIVGAAALGIRALTGEPIDTVLFSGDEATAEVLGIGSLSALVAIAIAKTIAYAVSLGGGFRGGMVFPAVFLGVVVATACAQVLDTNVSAMVAAGIAAGVAGVLRLPFTGVLMALLLCSVAGLAVTTPAIIGAVVGVLVRVAADAKFGRQDEEQAEEPALV